MSPRQTALVVGAVVGVAFGLALMVAGYALFHPGRLWRVWRWLAWLFGTGVAWSAYDAALRRYTLLGRPDEPSQPVKPATGDRDE